MKPERFAKTLAVVAILTALAGVASAATMLKKGTMTMPSPTPIMKPMM